MASETIDLAGRLRRVLGTTTFNFAEDAEAVAAAAAELGRLRDARDAAVAAALKAFGDLDGDPEGDHLEADRILLAALRAVGCGAVADAYAMAKESTGFWYA